MMEGALEVSYINGKVLIHLRAQSFMVAGDVGAHARYYPPPDYKLQRVSINAMLKGEGESSGRRCEMTLTFIPFNRTRSARPMTEEQRRPYQTYAEKLWAMAQGRREIPPNLEDASSSSTSESACEEPTQSQQ